MHYTVTSGWNVCAEYIIEIIDRGTCREIYNNRKNMYDLARGEHRTNFKLIEIATANSCKITFYLEIKYESHTAIR